MHKKTLTSSFLLTALLLTGCGANQNNDQASSGDTAAASSSSSATASDTTSASPSTSQSSSASSDPSSDDVDLASHDFPVTWKDALKKAQDRFQGDVSKIELESQEGGGYEYKVEMYSDSQKYAAQIDADSGDLINEKKDDEDDGAKKRQEKSVNLDDVIDVKKAMDTAQKERDGAVNKWKLEGKSSGPQYEFDITNPNDSSDDYEVQVNATSGDVISKG